MAIDVTQIVVAVVGLLMTVITALLIPWVRSKLTAEQWNNLKNISLAAVQAVEILFKASSGEEKKHQAMQRIQELCKKHGMNFDEMTIGMAIENAWKQLGFDRK